MEGDAVLVLWGKTGKGDAYHPLLCHMIDVALVVRRLWHEVLSPAARQTLSARLGLSEDTAGRWISLLAGLHDLGKATPAFATRGPARLAAAIRARLPCPSKPPDTPHGILTARLLPGLLVEFGCSEAFAAQASDVLGGHHGVFPDRRKVCGVESAATGGRSWQETRLALGGALARVLEIPLGTPPRGRLDASAALFLAGFVSVADWIGSAADYFEPAVSSPEVLAKFDGGGYAAGADETAALALDRLGWTGWEPSGRTLDFREIFPELQGPPRPVQEAVIELAGRLNRRAMVIIEAPMGEGKTEAAMYLADALSRLTGQRGHYFALPTQATSDQMFGRVKAFLARRYPESVVNLQLLHGHAALSAEFAELRKHGDRIFAPVDVRGEGRDIEERVVAAEWFTYRKRGLLAPFGIGTVDQALLGVLQTRHVFVRLFGLAHKVVIIDEVHAYDTYMTALLERLLEWLAALGSSVVLLSATLPDGRRRALADAYARGLAGGAATAPVPDACYPRISWLTAGTTGAQTVGVSSKVAQQVSVEWVDGHLPEREDASFPLGEALRSALASGGCAAVICNTVGRAQAMYRALERFFPGLADDGEPVLDLLHSRYPFDDRESREKRALVRFGKPGGQVAVGEGKVRPVRRPDRAVLIATQIVEQSLDLDFDLMVSDLAPADLVLQRSGRLWRHERVRHSGVAARGRALWLCRPSLDAEGVPEFPAGDKKVYDNHVLLRSWLALQGRAELAIPGEVWAIVEEVYDDRACPAAVGDGLRRRWEETRREYEEDLEHDRREAKTRWLRPPWFDGSLSEFTADPKEEDAPSFHRAHQALTRLAEPTVQVVLLYETRGCASLDREGHEIIDLAIEPSVAIAKQLLRRSVPVSDKRVVYWLLREPVPKGWEKSPLLRHHRPLLLDARGSALAGGHRLRLDCHLGLLVE